MTIEKLIEFHERELKDEKSKRVTLGDDLTYRGTVYAQTLSALHELVRARKQLAFLADRVNLIIEDLSPIIAQTDDRPYDEDTLTVGELYKWSGKLMRAMEAIV